MDDKVKVLKFYEKKIDEIISKKDEIAAKELQKEIISVFYSEIKDLTLNLNTYNFRHLHTDYSYDYLDDLRLLKAKLANYRASLKSNKVTGTFPEKLSAHPLISVISIAASCLAAYAGITAFIMNISNTTIITKDTYVLKTELDEQYISREQYNSDIQSLQDDNKRLKENEGEINLLNEKYKEGWYSRYDELKKERDSFERELENIINFSTGLAGYDDSKNIEKKQELRRKIDSRNEAIANLVEKLNLEK